MRIILLGPPGSGKGTQAIRLSRDYDLPHISTGDMLREAVSGKDRMAQKIKEIMESGALVPDEIIFSILEKRLKKEDTRKGFVLDGFPRNLEQARELDKILGDAGDFVVFDLVVGEDTVVRRLSKRRVCKKCRVNYHLEFQPPKIGGKCDECGFSLYQRDDDKPEAIKNRLKVYNKESRPLAEYYKERGSLISINAELDEEQVFASIREKLEK